MKYYMHFNTILFLSLSIFNILDASSGNSQAKTVPQKKLGLVSEKFATITLCQAITENRPARVRFAFELGANTRLKIKGSPTARELIKDPKSTEETRKAYEEFEKIEN